MTCNFFVQWILAKTHITNTTISWWCHIREQVFNLLKTIKECYNTYRLKDLSKYSILNISFCPFLTWLTIIILLNFPAHVMKSGKFGYTKRIILCSLCSGLCIWEFSYSGVPNFVFWVLQIKCRTLSSLNNFCYESSTQLAEA